MMTEKRIILLHGWGAGIEKLKPLTEELRRLQWKTVNLELPGFDKQKKKKIWGVGDYANYVLSQAKIQFGNKNFFVFGHSFGGRIAIKIASQNPSKLEGVILCSAGGVSRGYNLVRMVFFVLAKTGKIFLLFPPLALFWRKVLYKLAREHDYEKAEGIMKEIFKKVITEDIKPLIYEIKIKTLILWGNLDRVTPEEDAYFIQKALLKSKLIIFNGQGHQLPYRKPEKVAREITKWSETSV